MTAERLSMRTIREVLRLKWEKKLSNKQIAKSCNIARSTIRDYLDRAQRADMSWPLPPDLDDGRLEALLYPSAPEESSGKRELPASVSATISGGTSLMSAFAKPTGPGKNSLSIMPARRSP